MNMQTKATLCGLAACGLAVILVMGVPKLGGGGASSAPSPQHSSSTPTSSRLESGAIRSSATAAIATVPASMPASTSATPRASSAPTAPAAAGAAALSVAVKPIRVGDEPIKPIPTVDEFFEDHLEIEKNAAKIELGRRLFHDTRLSHDDTISCASCHDLRFGGVDRSRTAIGVEGQIGPINTPTVFNAALNVQQFWDGRAADLEKQADGPPNAAGEMASNWNEINSKLLKDDHLVQLLRQAFKLEGEIAPDVSKDYWLEAISDFERTLITPGAPFDAYLQGQEDAISQEAKEGYQLFKDIGCIECHNGMAVGGASFQKLGRKNPYFGAHTQGVDLGRFNVTKKDEDKNVFKVPGLRNVSMTGPWFHDGSQTTLENATRTMARVQLDREVSDAEVERIVAFLRSLTGSFDGRSVDVAGTGN